MRSLLITVTLATLAPLAWAEDLQPLMCVKGKQVVNEDFSGPSVPKAFVTGKGSYTIENGAMKGVELKADNHPASNRVQLKVTTVIYQFDFKFAGATSCHLNIDVPHAHLCRLVIEPKGITLHRSENNVILDSCLCEFKPGQWYTIMMEMTGDEMLAHVDDTHYAFGADAKLNCEKGAFGFPVVGDAMYFDNVKVWEATANPQWPDIKAKLRAARPADPKAVAKKKA